MTATDAGERTRPGRWLARALVGVGGGALLVAVTTPPRSGPFCRSDCLTYPYVGGAEFVPRDFWWMYPAIAFMLLLVPFTALLARRAGSRAAALGPVCVALATLIAGLLVTAYAVQLAVVQPSLLAGETDGLAIWSQYNPHGVFIALEDAGYALLGVLFLVLSRLLPGPAGPERAMRAVLVVAGVAILVALVWLPLRWGTGLDYRFEVLGILFGWTALIALGVLADRLLARDVPPPAHPPGPAPPSTPPRHQPTHTEVAP